MKLGLLAVITCLTPTSGFGQEALWKKHLVHEGFHTNTAVAADYTGDGKIDIIANNDNKTRLFVAPDWKETVISDSPEHNLIHSETFDVDGDGDHIK